MLRAFVEAMLPEAALSALRGWRKQLRRGLPRGLQWPVLEGVLAMMHRGNPRSVCHCKLSSWKDAGTFRLFVRFRDGTEARLVYKRAVYSLDEIPANAGLPLRQGPPEFVIVGATDGPLARFVPRAYWSKACDDGFEYLWEDLGEDFVSFVEYQQSSPRTDLCEPLAAMHRALREQFSGQRVADLLDFDGMYSERIWEYAMRTLQAYFEATGEPVAGTLLARQKEVRSVFLDRSFQMERPTQVIHGDCNSSNLWVRRKADALQLKAVDWEWAGYGMPHADIISVVKGRTDGEKKEFLERYCTAAGLANTAREWHWLRRASMERSILDAAFLAKQSRDPLRSRQWFTGFIRRSLEDLLRETTRFASGDA